MPIEPELAVTDAPVFHDVQQTADDFWSGELRCTLTALTPLLAGNYQYEYEHLAESVQQAFQDLARGRGATGQAKPDKKVLEPLCLPGADQNHPGAVLIAGAALKGMARGALQALLSAPMERVQERTFSFRPNLMNDANVRPAIVHSVANSSGELNAMEVVLGNICSDVVYVQGNAERALEAFLGQPLANFMPAFPRATVRGTVPDVKLDVRDVGASKIRKLQPKPRGCEPLNHVLACYREGLDGTSTFKRAFGRGDGYAWALLPAPTGKPEPIPPEVLENFCATIEHIGDSTTGHLVSHPLDRNGRLDRVPKNAARFPQEWPQIGDLMFVEYDRDPTDPRAKIVGIGHHFRHRQRYRDTIHLSRDPGYSRAAKLRDILCPGPLEIAKQQGPYAGAPRQLTAGRGLFGYVAGDRAAYDPQRPNEPLTFGIGDGDFQQLAGRIAFNMAVEANPGLSLEQRFMNAENNNRDKCLVPLRPLGAPKPSAVETYLTQDRLGKRADEGTLCTYGDTPDDPAAGNLRGRKFYLHQPAAATDRKCYELLNQQRDSGDSLHIVDNQALLARFVSRPETAFKFAVRFRDLRGWELGALLFVLAADENQVQQLAGALDLPASAKLTQWLERIRQWNVDPLKRPLLALKLGHGRPLGLGSVRIEVDQISRLRLKDGVPFLEVGAPEAICRQTVAKLAEKIKQGRSPAEPQRSPEEIQRWADGVLLPWLQVHRYAGRKAFSYPSAEDRGNRTIYNFHTNQRRLHAAGRKRPKSPGQAPRRGGLKSLDDLDQEGQ